MDYDELKKPATRTKAEVPTEADLVQTKLESLKAEHESLKDQLQSTQLTLKALLGKTQTSEEVVIFSKRVMERLQQRKKQGGKFAWRILDKRFSDSHGNPVSHVIWSNARDPKEAVADFKRRSGASWDVSEGRDPYDAEPLVTD